MDRKKDNMPDTYTLTVTIEPATPQDARAKLIEAIQALRCVQSVTSHLWYSTGGRVKEARPLQFDYWDTLIELIERDPTIPISTRNKISMGTPSRWEHNTLVISHPDAAWANERFARTFTNMIVGLCPGASVHFDPALAADAAPDYTDR
jgi:hypothetical protein